MFLIDYSANIGNLFHSHKFFCNYFQIIFILIFLPKNLVVSNIIPIFVLYNKGTGLDTQSERVDSNQAYTLVPLLIFI